MGYILNHAIVVTATYDGWVERAHTKAKEIFGDLISPITSRGTNGSQSFLIPPDGSKEGWSESREGDERRDSFKKWLVEQAYEDGSSPISWAEITYGGDDQVVNVIAHSGDTRKTA